MASFPASGRAEAVSPLLTGSIDTVYLEHCTQVWIFNPGVADVGFKLGTTVNSPAVFATRYDDNVRVLAPGFAITIPFADGVTQYPKLLLLGNAGARVHVEALTEFGLDER